jgi:hypothetical protein
MATRRFKKLIQVGALSGMFAGGFLCGSVVQRPADAQMGELGDAVMKKAGESGGSLGSAAQLGSSILEMQQHVTGLQKNLDSLNKIKAALGG